MNDKDKTYLLKELMKTIDESDPTAAFCLCQRWILKDALALLKAQESAEANYEHQCNKCKFYEGVHNTIGHAPCSFWNIGGVMWNDYCSRFNLWTGGEVEWMT